MDEKFIKYVIPFITATMLIVVNNFIFNALCIYIAVNAISKKIFADEIREYEENQPRR